MQSKPHSAELLRGVQNLRKETLKQAENSDYVSHDCCLVLQTASAKQAESRERKFSTRADVLELEASCSLPDHCFFMSTPPTLPLIFEEEEEETKNRRIEKGVYRSRYVERVKKSGLPKSSCSLIFLLQNTGSVASPLKSQSALNARLYYAAKQNRLTSTNRFCFSLTKFTSL